MKSHLDVFKKFSKGEGNSKFKSTTKNAVIYTRVSSKEQKDNLSLSVQLKACKEYADKNGLNVVKCFGQTYESAKSDDRKQFLEMLNYIHENKGFVDTIIVYSIERFSRTGISAIAHLQKLHKEYGVKLKSATQETDTESSSGRFYTELLLIFGRFDNDLRRDKCVAGMVEMLQRGYWVGKAPFGFDSIKENGEQKIIVNKNGELIRKAFIMKANEGLSNVEILTRLKALGLNIHKQKLTDIFRNPFYCGIVAHGLLNGEIVKGRQEVLISEEIFLRVNNLQAKNQNKYFHNTKEENLPLRGHVKCNVCNTPFTGYEVKKKKIFYYKCNKIGCKCNRSAKFMHNEYSSFISSYSITDDLLSPVKLQLQYTFTMMNEKNEENRKALNRVKAEIEDKIEKVEERFALGEINQELFQKINLKYKAELDLTEKELEKVKVKLSNLENYINFSLEIASNLSKIWVYGDIDMKGKLQSFIFPEGVIFDKEKNSYRTNKINSILTLIGSLSGNADIKKKGQTNISTDLSCLVAGAGLEPAAFGL
ncbi:MAG: recombinase family protein [Cytophagaceae bacterium]